MSRVVAASNRTGHPSSEEVDAAGALAATERIRQPLVNPESVRILREALDSRDFASRNNPLRRSGIDSRRARRDRSTTDEGKMKTPRRCCSCIRFYRSPASSSAAPFLPPHPGHVIFEDAVGADVTVPVGDSLGGDGGEQRRQVGSGNGTGYVGSGDAGSGSVFRHRPVVSSTAIGVDVRRHLGDR